MSQNWRRLLVAILVVISLSSCQPKSITTPTLESLPLSTQNETFVQPIQVGEPSVQPSPDQPEAPTPQGVAPYPSSAQAELASPPTAQNLPNTPTAEPGVSVYSPYPGPSENVNSYLEWAAAKELILAGKVSKIYDDSRNHLTLVLKDGNVDLTLQPAPDEVLKVIKQCGEPCADIEQIKEP